MILYRNHKAASYTVGGKAKGLYRLEEESIQVPPFLVIPAEVFDVAPEHLSTDEASIHQRKEQLLNFTLPEDDREQIKSILESWGFPQQAVVVRSSIADEDSARDAFPGIMDSFLNLVTLPDVLDAIARCAASAYNERAVAYRRQRKLTPVARPAVIVQKQIIPVASGVLFTTFPEYPQELAIHATWGFGEGLVGGTLEADEFYLLKNTGEPHRQVLVQKETKYQAQETTGLTEAVVPEEHQRIACLTPGQLQELFRIGSLLEKKIGHPQDIEFVVTQEQTYLVQSRPVTQPIPEIVVYDNSNIQESYCGVTTPLTFSFARRAYATVYRQTMQVLALPDNMIQAHEEVVNNLLGLVKGRIYYNINNWYRGLQLLPSFRQNKEDMERMMGVEEPVDFVEDKEKTLLQKIQLLPGLTLNLVRLLWTFSRLQKLVSDFQMHFQQHYRRFYQLHLDTVDVDGLLAQKEMLDKELLQNWTTPIINDFYVMMTNGSVMRKLRKAGIQQPDEFLSRYLSGDQQIESAQPTRAMQALAARAREQEALRTLIVKLPEDLHEQVKIQFPDFGVEAEAFIARYGDRTVGELKLETLTMRLQPLIFYKYLRNYLASDSAPAAQETNRSLHTAARAELEKLLGNRTFFFRRNIFKALSKLQEAIRYRESMRLERTRLFGMYRALYLAMGRQLVQSGRLVRAEDVFYLAENEILQALDSASAIDAAQVVQNRKIEFSLYKEDEVPSRVIVPSPPVAEKEAKPVQAGILQGTGCFPGVVTGELVVITDPGSDLDVRDKIICALRTDPGWAALFPVCRGVLIEKGSSLSHSVILLRELGIPAIINIANLTKRLHTGQQVVMDGATGEIKLLP